METIHTRIKKLRDELGMSMKELANKVGVSAWQTVQQWEKENGTAPKRDRLKAVADALGTTPEYLTYGPGAHTDFAQSMRDLLIEVDKVIKDTNQPVRDALSNEAVKVGAAFDRVQKKEHKQLIVAALRAFGGWIDDPLDAEYKEN